MVGQLHNHEKNDVCKIIKLTKLEYYNIPYVHLQPKRAVNDVVTTITSDIGQC